VVQAYAKRILTCALASALVHAVAVRALEQMPGQALAPRPRIVQVQVVRMTPPEPEPEPPTPPPPPEPEPPVPVHEASPEPVKPRPRKPAPKVAPPKSLPAKNNPVTERPAATDATTDTPTFGFSLESTSASGGGPAMPVGNTLQTPQAGPAKAPGIVRPLAAPVPVYEVSKMPEMRSRCRGTYTPTARSAGIEGTVVLDLVVNADGTTSDIRVVQGLGHGLDEAARDALRSCRFTPGEKAGVAVAVRVRAFKIRFFLQDAP